MTTPRSLATAGFIGSAEPSSVINNCLAKVDISAGIPGSNSYNGIGGFAGWNTGEINNSYATGNVAIVDSQYGGGFAGSINDDQTITNSYSTGDVKVILDSNRPLPPNIQAVGGFLGVNNTNAQVENVYATGNVTIEASSLSIFYAGGLIGNSGPGTLTNHSYATGNVSVLGPTRSGSGWFNRI